MIIINSELFLMKIFLKFSVSLGKVDFILGFSD